MISLFLSSERPAQQRSSEVRKERSSHRERESEERETEMEACCFVSSNAIKPLVVKSELFAGKNRKKSSPYKLRTQGENGAVSSPQIRCQLGSSPSNQDDEAKISGDWRSFRARLVAAERISRPMGDPISSVDPEQVMDYPLPNLAIGDKWAHAIPEPEKGCLLIATEKLDGVHIFERTVILLLSTGPVGPTGVILNRPSLMSIKETRSSVLDRAGTFLDRPLFFGGPLEEGLFLLSRPNGGSNGVFEEVVKGLYYGRKEAVGCAAEMVRRNLVGPDDFRFFDGYCGWEKEQLRGEIRAGYWTVAACGPGIIGLDSVGKRGLWEEVLGLMGSKKVW